MEAMQAKCPKNNKGNVKGFTLIELMIVLAILSIIVGVAVPAYQDFTVRAKVAEGMNVATTAKNAVVETLHSLGNIPNQTSTGFQFFGTKYVQSVTIASGTGVIEITTRDTGAPVNPVLQLTPDLTNTRASLRWSCTLSAGETRHVPSECRGP
jgi:type IV pilus assembly protein PilA